MLGNYLQEAILDINCLIDITKQDIEDIKLAKHEQVFSRTKQKDNLITSFGAKKSALDNQLVSLVQSNPDKKLENIISEEDAKLLEEMKTSLQELQSLNKKYAKFVVAVSEFYNSLMDKMFPSENNGYAKATSKPATFLKVRV